MMLKLSICTFLEEYFTAATAPEGRCRQHAGIVCTGEEEANLSLLKGV